MSDRSLIRQCGNCSTLFLQPGTVEIAGNIYEVCPNPVCYGPIKFCDSVMEAAVSWAFMHIIQHSGISETRRMNLRMIAESEMGPWQFQYRSF